MELVVTTEAALQAMIDRAVNLSFRKMMSEAPTRFPQPLADDVYLTIKQAISPGEPLHGVYVESYVRELIANKEIPFTKRGRRVLLQRGKLKAWLAESPRRSNTEIARDAADFVNNSIIKKR